MRSERKSGRARTMVLLALTMVACAVSDSAPAQDSHYWSDQWGTRSNLLGGVVIGSASDLSSTYYNPGFLALESETSLFLATKVYQLTSFRLPGLREDQVDLSSTRLSAAPDFIAGEFTFDWLGVSGRLAYSLLTRYNTSFEIKGRAAQPAMDDSGPVSTLSSGEILSRQNLSEYWAGITYAQPILGKLGLGGTLYGAYRSQRHRKVFSAARTDSTLQTEAISGISDGSYWNGRFLMKFGLAWRGENLTLGMNYTTPSLNVLGQGSYFEHVATAGINGLDPPIDGSYQNAFYEDGLEASYKSSWAWGLGASYRFGTVRIHAAGEYFDEVDPYLVMQTSEWYPQTGGELRSRSTYQTMKSVFNLGLGIMVPLNESWVAYGSVITDRSGAIANPEGRDTLGTAVWDVIQFSSGAEINFDRGELTLGMSYSFANDTVLLDDTITEGNTPILGNDVQVRYRRLKFLFGFVINFGEGASREETHPPNDDE